MSVDAWLVFIGAMLLLFGLGYARYITYRPARPGLQCEEVVFGCTITLSGASLAALILNGNWWQTAGIFWVTFALTGMPMWIFKRLQDEKRKKEADHYMDKLMKKRATRWPDAH